MHIYLQFVKRTLILFSLVGIVGVIILALTGLQGYILGWLWGIGTNILYFLLLAIQMQKMRHVTIEELKVKMRVSMISRFSLIIVMTIIGSRVPGVELLGVLSGLIMFKPIHYIDYFILKNRSYVLTENIVDKNLSTERKEV